MFAARAISSSVLLTTLVLLATTADAARVVPGTGFVVEQVGDDFENEHWGFAYNHPKSSRNIDKQERSPLAESRNGRWLEGPHRGTPDLMRRVPTPPGGLPGSQGALLMRTRQPGIPGRATGQPQQDDIMIKVRRRLGSSVSPEWNPNCVVRVFVPPFDEWEDRTGTSFGFRTDCWGSKPGQSKVEQFWPGIFINFRSKTDPGFSEDSAFLTIRADARGRDIRGPEVFPGWWTMGMSVSPDGMCHFYAKEGLDDLTEEDHLASYFCYGYRVKRFDLFFFNVVAQDNGRTWSTPWIIDDATFYWTRELATRSDRRQRR